MRVMAEKIRKERQPLFIQIAKNMLKTERGYDAVADDILKQAEQIEMSLILIHGQIEHRYEDYVSTLIRHNRFVEGVIRSAENKMITGHRSDRETRAEEEKIFDKGFEEELKKEAVTIEKESKPKE